MKRLNEKGFTIVELVIVIAVVAVLAAVLIPTFSEVIEEAQMAKDLTLYRNIQTIIQAEKTLGSDISDYEKAKEVLRKNGINDITTYSDTYSITWDDDSKSFVLVSSDGLVVPDGESSEVIDVQPDHPEDDENEGKSVSVVRNLDKEIFDFDKIPETASLNGTYSAQLIQLSAQKEYYVTSFSITMGGVDITPEGFDPNDENAVIDIPEVTAEITISATTVVNQVRLSLDLSGEYIYGNTDNGYNSPQSANGSGYIDNACISVNTNQKGICASVAENYAQARGCTATGWIKIPWDNNQLSDIDIYIFIKIGTLELRSGSSCKYFFYNDTKNSSYTKDFPDDVRVIKDNYYKITISKEHYNEGNSDYNYFRLSVPGIGENLIVTVNEQSLPDNSTNIT